MTMTTVHDGHVWIEVIRPNGEHTEVMLPDNDDGTFTDTVNATTIGE